MLIHEEVSDGMSDPNTECHRQPPPPPPYHPHHVHHHYEPVVKETHPHSFRHHCQHHDLNGSLVASPPRQCRPLPPCEFVVKKQGRFEEDNWRTRILSLDHAHHRLYLSKSSKVDTLYHRCMVRMDLLKFRPTFHIGAEKEDGCGDSVRWTVCVKGLVGVQPSALTFAARFFTPGSKVVANSSVLGRFLGGKKAMKEEQEEITMAQLAAMKQLDPPLAPAPARDGVRQPTEVDINDFGEFTTEVWTMRAMSTKDMMLLAQALRRTVPDTCVVSGYRKLAIPEESEE